MITYIIKAYDPSRKNSCAEVIDSFMTLKEAMDMLNEYKVAFNGAMSLWLVMHTSLELESNHGKSSLHRSVRPRNPSRH